MTENVMVGSTAYPVYASIEQADAYLAANSAADAWRALTDDNVKARLLVTSTRTLDRQIWKGTKTATTQALEWPRKDTGVDGVTDDVVPTDIMNGSIELALSLLASNAVQTAQNQSQQNKMLKAGSVAIEFFRGADGTPLRFPLPVQELVGPYLDAELVVGSLASGTDGESLTNDSYDYNQPL